MSFQDCMAAVATALGRRITIEEFDALFERLDAERGRLFAEGYPADWLAAARTVARQIEIEKAVAQRQVIRNKLVYRDGMSFLAAARQTVDAGLALEARLVGINTPIAGGRKSVAAEAHGIYLTSAGALLADLRRLGNGDRLVRLFSEPSFELDIAKALRGEAAHPDAVTIAGAIERVREDLRRQENDSGGWRGKLDGYVTRQSHDSLRVRRAGYDRWRADILPRLDQAQTFQRQEELLAQLREERRQVRVHSMVASAEMGETLAALRSENRLDEKATARGRRLSADERQSAGQIEEARKAMADALGRYMDLAQKAREGGREAAPLFGERGTQDVSGRQLGEARVALTRARERLDELHRQATAGRGRTIENDLVRQHLAERVELAAQLAERAERAADLIGELWERMFEYDKRIRGPVDPDTFLRRIYNSIAADTWMRGDSQEFRGLMSAIGPQNLARKRAAHRELHFKSAEDELAYQRQYGQGGVADNIIREIEGAASAISLQRNLGTNPEAMFQLWRSELLREAKNTGDNALATAVTRRRLDWQLAEVTGAARQVANPTLASRAASIRVLQSMARLGGAMLSSFGDVATAAAELRYQGRGALQGYADMLEGMFRGRRSGERRIVADLLGVGFESLSGTVLARIGGESAPPGGISRAAALFFRLNGLSWWTDAHKTTAGLVLSRYFALQREHAFEALPRPTQRTLTQYGLTPADWNVLRSAAVHAAEDGVEFLTPENVRQIPLGQFMARSTDIENDVIPSERVLREARDRVAGAYAALITDRVDHAVVTPGARERAMVNLGTERGDYLGEALRFVMQFKSFSVAMMTRSIGRDLHGGEGGRLSATARVAFLAFQLGVWGYLAMSAKELLAGKNPRDPSSPNTWAAALMQGGGLGILGDYAFGQFNRFGQSAIETAAGPTFGTASDLMSLYAQARDPEGAAAGRYGPGLAAHGLRFAASNTPFANLWWLQPALKYLALYPVQEALSPGYLRRTEQRIQRENKQTFWLSPQEAPRL